MPSWIKKLSGCRKQRHIKIEERIKIRKIIIVTCGDDAEKSVKFLKEKFGYSKKESDDSEEFLLTIAGGSRSFTSKGCTDDEAKLCVEDKRVAMRQLYVYIGDADEVLIILIDHNRCAAWHKFLNEKKERIWHIESLQSAKKIIESELKRKKKNINLSLSIKLFYIERDGKKRITNIEEVRPY